FLVADPFLTVEVDDFANQLERLLDVLRIDGERDRPRGTTGGEITEAGSDTVGETIAFAHHQTQTRGKRVGAEGGVGENGGVEVSRTAFHRSRDADDDVDVRLAGDRNIDALCFLGHLGGGYRNRFRLRTLPLGQSFGEELDDFVDVDVADH